MAPLRASIRFSGTCRADIAVNQVSMQTDDQTHRRAFAAITTLVLAALAAIASSRLFRLREQ